MTAILSQGLLHGQDCVRRLKAVIGAHSQRAGNRTKQASYHARMPYDLQTTAHGSPADVSATRRGQLKRELLRDIR